MLSSLAGGAGISGASMSIDVSDPGSAWTWFDGQRASLGSANPFRRQVRVNVPTGQLRPWTLNVLADAEGRKNWGMRREDLYDVRGLRNALLNEQQLETGALGTW